jgi:glycosyltransferase involved in cell wall biosynthesis
MYEKLARSLLHAGYNDLHLIGYPITARSDVESGLTFHPLDPFPRLSVSRLFARWRILKLVSRLRPTVFVITTHELIGVALLVKFFLRSKIVYDIQENYFENIKASTGIPKVLRYFLAGAVRLKEVVSIPFFDAIWLAEKGYAEEMPYAGKHGIVLENKFVVPDNFMRRPLPGLNLLFSGTLARSTGVFEVIRLAEKLNAKNDAVRLSIAGYCAHQATWQELERSIRNKPFINIIGGSNLVPHEEIVKAISNAHFGIICYPGTDHVRNRIPTKLYEYLACRLPVLLENNPQWMAIAATVNGYIPVDFDHPDIESILMMMHKTGYCVGPIDGFLWEPEVERLVESGGELCGA